MVNKIFVAAGADPCAYPSQVEFDRKKTELGPKKNELGSKFIKKFDRITKIVIFEFL